MFRRRRSASQHRHQHQLSTSNTQNAQSAATRAFIQSQPSSSNLSSAAAAAALRSLTPTPTPVENVQTKRMLQRRSSISSHPVGSATLRPSSRNGLLRSSSSASMSARTFRDHSPGRPSSSYSTISTPTVVPPLPSMPPEFSGRKNQSRRSVSLGPSAMSSSSHTQQNEGKRSVKPPTNVPDSPRVVASTEAGSNSPLHQRSESRNSINFSYPMNSRTNSPTIPSGFHDRQDSAVSAAPSLNERSSAQYHKNKTQAAAPGSPARNSHPVTSALAAAQAVTATWNEEPITPPASAPPARQQQAIVRSPSRSPASVDVKPRSFVKRTSAVSEDRPAKERFLSSLAPSSSPVPTPVNGTENRPSAVPSKEPPRALTPPIAENENIARTPPVSPPQVKPTTELVDEKAQPALLPQPGSPVRSAHFPSQLTVVCLPGDQLHQPASRSLSPAKSAMKNRNSSLSPDGRLSGILRPGPSLSELSDATSVASDDGVRPNHRKKPVRVSFDDEAEIVGMAASPPTSPEDIVPESPPGNSKSKASWFSIHKRKSSPLRSTDGDEFEEVFKPRATLPSFGSIRGNKDGGRPGTTIQHDVVDDSDLESDDDFRNDQAANSIVSRASEANLSKQEQTNIAPPIALTDAAARDAKKEAIPCGDFNMAPTFFQKTQLSPLVEVPSEQNLPLPEEQDSRIPDIPAMPDITLQPATPDPEKETASLEEWVSPEEYPRQSGQVEPEDSSELKGKRRHSVDDDSTSSVYSDAEGNLVGDGFGSINAIVDHKTVPSTPGVAVTTSQVQTHYAEHIFYATDVPETCQIARVQTPVQEDSPTPAPSSPGLIEPLPLFPPPAQPEAKAASAERKVNSSPATPNEVYSIAKSREDEPRKADFRPEQVKANSPNGRRLQQKSQKRETSTLNTRNEVNYPGTAELDVSGGTYAYVPRRQLSNGSDSSSSFKRARRAGRGGKGMRRTLRGSQQESSIPVSPSRAAAHVDPSPMLSTLGTGAMRTTLRNNSSRKEKPSFFSTGKAQKGKLAKSSSTPFASRFPDSDSDSDDGVQNRRLPHLGHQSARSMSVDGMRPVRGIPRRKDAYDGDSTELEDSSDGERRPGSAPRGSAAKVPAPQPQSPSVRDSALAAVAKSRGMTEEELEELLDRGSTGLPRKPNILNRLSMRKSKPVTQRERLQLSQGLSNGRFAEHPRAQSQHPEAENDSPKAVANSSKLTKKSLQKAPASEAWPLSSEEAGAVDSGIGSASSPSSTQQFARSQTPNEGAVNGNKPVSQQQTFGTTTECAPAQERDQFVAKGNRASDVVIEGSGRKKRFQRLKKAFGIAR